MRVLFTLLFSLFLFAEEYPYFTKNQLFSIEKSSGNISKNRILDYQNNIQDFKKYPKTEQLLRVNLYLNQLLPQYDDVIQKKSDYWATPKEFLVTGFGDCEDYVIIKYFTLLKLGFNKEDLFLTTVSENRRNGYHMVLSYFEKESKSPLILDNLSFRVLDLKSRSDLTADTFINSTGIYKINKRSELLKIQEKYKKFQDLIDRVKKESDVF